MKHRILLSLLLLFASTGIFIGCDSTEEATDLRADIVRQIGENVIIPVYHDLDEKGQALLVAVKNLRANPTSSSHLDAARAAWKAARTPFEIGEAFEFGPLKTLNIKPDVDSWPVQTVGDNSITQYLTDSSNFTKENVANYPQNIRGFHAIEFILWGDAENGIAPKLDANSLQFLEVMTEVTVEKMTLLHDEWEEAGGNYIVNLKEFGGSRVFATVKDALFQINERVYHIAEELEDEYLPGPLSNPRTAESYLSDMSHADFRDIMVGVRAVYYGDHDGVAGKGLTDFFAEKNPDLDATVKTQIDEATAAINALGPSFNTTVKNEPSKVQTAIDKCKALYHSLKDVGEPLISGS